MSRTGEHLGQTGSHGAGPDDCYLLDVLDIHFCGSSRSTPTGPLARCGVSPRWRKSAVKRRPASYRTMVSPYHNSSERGLQQHTRVSTRTSCMRVLARVASIRRPRVTSRCRLARRPRRSPRNPESAAADALTALTQVSRCLRAEAAGRHDDADAADDVAHLVPDRRGHGARAEVALFDVEGDALLAHPSQLRGELLRIGDGPGREPLVRQSRAGARVRRPASTPRTSCRARWPCRR